MTRREIREHVFVLLFQGEFYDAAEVEAQNGLYFENFVESASEEEIEYIVGRFARVRENYGTIDALLAEATSGWKLSRMGKVELSLLRLAVFEMNCDEEIPGKVAINEAVELAKKFGGVLSTVCWQNLRGNEVTADGGIWHIVTKRSLYRVTGDRLH